jgi:hypothetical protein
MYSHPPLISPNNFKCVQWNARGLTKAKLEEFRQFLSSVSPDIVLLSETHWKPYFNVLFKSYHVLKEDRPHKAGGGVAILIKKNIRFSPFSFTPSATIEAIGASILLSNNSQIDLISIYVPKGDCEVADVEHLFNRINPTLIGGDFNGHHSMWESDSQSNKAGRSIAEAILNSNSMCLLTPRNLGTRIDPGSGKTSTIDLTNATPARNSGQPPTWITNDKKWNDWNAFIHNSLLEANFHSISDPAEATSTFNRSIEAANTKFFKLSQPPSLNCVTQCRPWWNDACKVAVKTARKAFRKWRDSPLSPTLRLEWSRAEANKKKI